MSKKSDSDPAGQLANYEVLVCVCGGIAAYKVCDTVSKLVQRGAGVTVAMTRSARKFVTPLTFQALSHRRVLTSLWDADTTADIQHITATGVADLVLIAPATANMIGKIAGGLADDLVSTLMIGLVGGVDSPVFYAPAMNHRMWESPIVQGNVKKLNDLGFQMIDPGEGWLACREVGTGRMAEPADIVETIAQALQAKPPKQHQSDSFDHHRS